MMETQTVFDPISTNTKIALVTAVLAVNKMAKATFDNPSTKCNKPHKSQTRGKYQTGDAINIIQMSSLQIKTVSSFTINYLLS